ncbi:MAG: hypothetical protein F2954_00910 [Actinobacteria bacterium]|uniref:Unannotated protein n=1 Tax=freshwater metagenome TaxID=449393 RepID=A0A6J7VMB7_9ZZZZ|nr:hypothetical protein [Actinomycetota bacterium]
MTNPEKFRSGSALFTGWVLITFFIGFTIQSFFFGSTADVLITVLVCAIAIFGSYLCFIKPYVIVFDEGIKIVNPTKEITASWDRIDEIETKYSMAIFVDGRAYYAWAAPAPSRRHSRGLHKSDLLPGSDSPRRLGDSPKSDSGVCAHMARLRRKEFIAKGMPALYIFEIL